MRLEEYVQMAVDELEEWMKDNPGEEPDDMIHEIADSSCPVYNYEILRLASENITDIGLREAEIIGFDGTPTPVNVAVGAIYEHIAEKLQEYYNEHKGEEVCQHRTQCAVEHGELTGGRKVCEWERDGVVEDCAEYERFEEAKYVQITS